MSIQQHNRFPLGEYSQSRMNNLGLFGGNYLTGATTSMTTLPSIKSLINHTPMNDHILPQTQSQLQMRLQHPRLSLRNEPMLVRSQSLPIQPLRNYNDLSQKLKVRLQFAYYKYRTQQGDKKFAELKQRYTPKAASSNSEHHPVVSGARIHRTGQRKSTKRRKLVVSHGNYRTPSKKHAIKPISRSVDDTMADSSAHTSKSYSTYIDSSVSATVAASTTTTLPHPHNDTTVVGTLATPVRNQQKIALLPKQETPMSVKAAKSLIHLFTSSNQF